jgi:hypothetical protein
MDYVRITSIDDPLVWEDMIQVLEMNEVLELLPL